MKHFYSLALAMLLATGTAMAQTEYEVVESINIDVELLPAKTFNTTVDIPVEQITAAIGADPAANNVITMSGTDYVTETKTAGCGWFFKADGTPCGWGEDEVIYAKYENNNFIVGSDENSYTAGQSIAFKFGFYNGTKVAMMNVTLKFVAEKVAYETAIPFEMTEANSFDPFPLEFDLEAVTAALGEEPIPDDFALVIADGYEKGYTANNGFWLGRDAQHVGWGDDAVFYVEYHGGNTLSVGQMPDVCKAGDTYSVKVGFVKNGKAAILALDITITEAPEIVYEQVYTETLSTDVYINQEGTLSIDQDAIEAAIGCPIDQAKLIACDVDGKYVSSMTANSGYWYNKEGNTSGWGEGCSVFVEYHNDAPAQLTIGMFSGLAVGDHYTVKFGFANGEKAAMLTITVNIVAAPYVDYKVVYTADKSISLQLNTEYIPTPLTFDSEAIEAALGCKMEEAQVISVDADNKYVTTTTANNGFWYNKAGYPAGYGDNSGLFVEYHGGSTLNVGMFPENIAVGDIYTVKFGFAYGENVAMLTITGTITDTSSAELITVDGVTEVTVYNLQGIVVGSGADVNEATAGLPAGLYIANGKKLIVR